MNNSVDFIQITDWYLGPQTVDVSKVKLLVCDIDGTVADLSHRLHWIKNKPKNWEAFQAGCIHDDPITHTIDVVQLLSKTATVIFSSGRSEVCQRDTIDWLTANGLAFDDLFMRNKNDYRQDAIVKREMLTRIRKEYGEPDLVLDDRTQVVNMWRDAGLNCIQVNYGDF